MVAASAILVRPIGTAFPAAFTVAVLDLAHALVWVFFQQLSFRIISVCGRPFRRPVFFFPGHNFFTSTPKNLPQKA
jgi:hypothetical protein